MSGPNKPSRVDVHSPEALAAAGFGSASPVNPDAEIQAMQELTGEAPGALQDAPSGDAASPQPEEAEGLSKDPAVRLKQIVDLVHTFDDNAPGYEQMAVWKRQYKNVYVNEIFDEIFISRHFFRAEWLKFITSIPENTPEYQVDQMIVEKCLLYPKLTIQSTAILPAGAIPTLAGIIKINSMFIDPQALATRTLKL